MFSTVVTPHEPTFLHRRMRGELPKVLRDNDIGEMLKVGFENPLHFLSGESRQAPIARLAMLGIIAE